MQSAPTAAGTRTVPTDPDRVWAVVTDLTTIGERSPQTYRAKPLDERFPAKGSAFRGYNRHGVFRWATRSTVTVSEPGRTLAWRVSLLGLSVADWRIDVRPDGEGRSVVTQQTWDRRGFLLRALSPVATGVRDRAARNGDGISQTLRGLDQQLTP
jgi:hypothetical protein